MPAASVTGIGQGEAGQFSKGPDGGFSSPFQTLVSVANNAQTLVVGEIVAGSGEGDFDARVTFDPALEGSSSNYIVMLHEHSETKSTTVTAKTDDADGNFLSFELSIENSDTVQFAVVRKSNSVSFTVLGLG